jgi:hypothetical protein
MALDLTLLRHGPFATIVEANTFLHGQKLTPDQLALYEKAFVKSASTSGPRKRRRPVVSW